MKFLLQLLVSVILHPIAVILMWINLAGRDDIGKFQKILWAILGLVWGIGPLLYIILGGGSLW